MILRFTILGGFVKSKSLTFCKLSNKVLVISFSLIHGVFGFLWFRCFGLCLMYKEIN